MDKHAYSVADVAVRLGVSTRTVQRLVASNQLLARNISTGRIRPHWRISARSLKSFQSKRRRKP